MSKLIVRALQGEVTEKIPFWLMRQAGRYLPEYRAIRKDVGSFLEMCYTPSLASEVTLQPIHRFHMDAAIIFSDILVIPHALGQHVEFIAGEGPKLEAISHAEQINQLGKKSIHETLSPVYEALKIVKGELPHQTALIGFSGAPWTLACYMIEGGGSKNFDSVRRFAYSNEIAFSKLIRLLEDTIADYLSAKIEAGADVIQLFDSWAGVASACQFQQWIIEPTRRIVAAVKQKHPHIPIIGFPRAAGIHYPEYAKQTGVDAVSIDYQTPLAWVRDHISIPLQGNLDPLLLAGDMEGTIVKIESMIRCMKDRPYIFNLGHGVVPYTPVEHVERLAEHIRNIRR